jgi:molecular chaperone GrpE
MSDVPQEGKNSDLPEASQSDLQAQFGELRAEVEKYKNDYLYLRADFENYKKNAIKERSDYLKYGGERLVVDLLNVFDNFERALEAKVTTENFGNFVKGIEMTAGEMRALLKKHGVTDVPSQGQPFDPNMHEALGAEESAQHPAGHVVRVFKKPYKLHDKLIRPGQVVVAKQPSN